MKEFRKQARISKHGVKTREYLSVAYRDYLSARVLLNAGLLSTGAILASTAIEKYCKAILAFSGNVSPGHLKKAHRNAAINFSPRLEKALGVDFVELLRRAYRLRYIDDLKIGFNLVIAQREFLAELDSVADILQARFPMSENKQLEYDVHREQKDQRLFLNNYVLSEGLKQDFISKEPQLVYEARLCKLRGFLEAIYTTAATETDGEFLRQGFTPQDDEGMRYRFAFQPL